MVSSQGVQTLLVLAAFAGHVSAKPTKEVGVVFTHWATPRGPNPHYLWGVSPRAMLGPIQHASGELDCTEEFVGKPPHSFGVGLLPFAIMTPVAPLTSVYDGHTVFRYDSASHQYIPLSPNLKPIPADQVNASKLVPASKAFDTKGVPMGPDPRDGTDHLREWVTLPTPNGVPDIQESTALEMLRGMRMVGAPEEAPERDAQDPVAIGIQHTSMQYVKEEFTDADGDELLSFAEGGYAEVNDPTGEHPENFYPVVEDSAVSLAVRGSRKILIVRETTDNNNYANEVQSGSYIRRGLCLHGFKDTVTTKQVKQAGRTPEYNEALMRILGRQLSQEWIDKSKPVAIIYMSRGMPAGVPEADHVRSFDFKDLFASPMKHATEVYHENVLLNFLSFKRRAIEVYGKDFKLVFERKVVTGSDHRMDNHLVYGTTTNLTSKDSGTNGAYKTWRTALNDVKSDGIDQGVTILSHWDYSWYESIVKIRELNKVPMRSIKEIQNGFFNGTWCENRNGMAIGCSDPTAFHFSVAETFDNNIDEFSNGYSKVIRGGVERMGVLAPKLNLKVLGKSPMSRNGGGTVSVKDFPLAGAQLDIPKDPQPGAPDTYTPKNATVTDDPTKSLDCMWKDYDGEEFFIASIGNLSSMPSTNGIAKQLISHPVYVGPYRVMFNRPVFITVPLKHGTLRPNGGSVPRPVVYNHVIKDWEPVLKPPGVKQSQPARWYDSESNSVVFATDVLGAFALISDVQDVSFV